ncbi:unnamed protein product [Ceutorhynchus assimilis]|uniref:Peptidase aspartic putative domain-containing protein n=1 Tax=Ceutorhynchus assimilis TaxID=467358 RepID=A0A9N9MK03_9CUCU|nr:unnamed protein product [Ceutorhynchus assimilis]
MKDSVCFDIPASTNYHQAKQLKLRKVRSVKNLALPNQHVLKSQWKHFSHLAGLPIQDINNPLFLIGQDNIRIIVPRKVVQGPTYLPIATKSMLGWILHGHYNDQHSNIPRTRPTLLEFPTYPHLI